MHVDSLKTGVEILDTIPNYLSHLERDEKENSDRKRSIKG